MQILHFFYYYSNYSVLQQARDVLLSKAKHFKDRRVTSEKEAWCSPDYFSEEK